MRKRHLGKGGCTFAQIAHRHKSIRNGKFVQSVQVLGVCKFFLHSLHIAQFAQSAQKYKKRP